MQQCIQPPFPMIRELLLISQIKTDQSQFCMSKDLLMLWPVLLEPTGRTESHRTASCFSISLTKPLLSGAADESKPTAVMPFRAITYL